MYEGHGIKGAKLDNAPARSRSACKAEAKQSELKPCQGWGHEFESHRPLQFSCTSPVYQSPTGSPVVATGLPVESGIVLIRCVVAKRSGNAMAESCVSLEGARLKSGGNRVEIVLGRMIADHRSAGFVERQTTFLRSTYRRPKLLDMPDYGLTNDFSETNRHRVANQSPNAAEVEFGVVRDEGVVSTEGL